MATNTYLPGYGGAPYPGAPYPGGNQPGAGYYQPTPQPPMMQQPQQQPGYRVQPVTGREEALAVPVDYLGAGTLLPDLAHGVIYLKRFNGNTGASDFLTFAYAAPQQDEHPGQVDLKPVMERIAVLEMEVEKLRTTAPAKGGRKNVPDAE